MRFGAALLLSILLIQDDSPLGSTPPPDCYDLEYDLRLFEAWGRHENAAGPFNADLLPQAPPLRAKSIADESQ